MVLAALILGGCSRGGGAITYPIYFAEGTKKVGIVISAPEKSDSVLNHLVLTEIQQFTADQDIEYKVVNPEDFINNAESLRYLAENEYDLIIALGKDVYKDVAKIAPEYPDIRFALLEGETKQENVASLVIEDEEGAFLAGAFAALLTKSNFVGYLGEPTGGYQQQVAFARGVQFVNFQEGKQVKISLPNSYTALTAGGDYQAGFTLANRLYWSGADVVFSTSPKYSGGLYDAARKNKRIAIMNDLGFLQANPWNIYASIVLDRNKAINDLLNKGVSGKLGGGLMSYGVSEEVVDLVLSDAVPQEIKDKLIALINQKKNNGIDSKGIILPEDLFVQLADPALPTPGPGGNTGGIAGNKTRGTTSGSASNKAGSTTGSSQGSNPGTVSGGNSGVAHGDGAAVPDVGDSESTNGGI